jgi:hypothetical protein
VLLEVLIQGLELGSAPIRLSDEMDGNLLPSDPDIGERRPGLKGT